ncbi:MAG: PilZ domain-containing protein [Pseudomonadota bacterium]|nr:PilZ domain-containing protein [Pseudomonadota bacterium]
MRKPSQSPPRSAEGGWRRGLALLAVRRVEQRSAERRRDQRDRSSGATAGLAFRRTTTAVAILNLSPGGAMIESSLMPFIGERVRISFGERPMIGATVRWLGKGRFGVEFVEPIELPLAEAARSAAAGRRSGEMPTPAKGERAPRQSVVWAGELFWEDRSAQVHLRNISAAGAMVSGAARLAAGTDVVLALKSAGTIFAQVRWCRAGRIGLKFDSPFDVRKLAAPDRHDPAPARAGVLKPHYLSSETDPNSPWAGRWDRLRPEDLG